MAEIVIDGFAEPIKAPEYIRINTNASAYVKYQFKSIDGTECIYNMQYGVRNYPTNYLPEYLEDTQQEIQTYPSEESLYRAEYLLMLEQEIKQVMAERLVGIGKKEGSAIEHVKRTFKG